MNLFSKMRFIVMFVTAVCVLFLVKLRWPKKKSLYCITLAMECSFHFGYVSTIVLTFLQVYFARSDSHLFICNFASISCGFRNGRFIEASKEIIRRKIKFAEVNKTELAAFMF